jgi:hypothetical protein
LRSSINEAVPDGERGSGRIRLLGSVVPARNFPVDGTEQLTPEADCNDYLDSWLLRAALDCGRKNVAQIYVWAADSGVVWAYFALAPDKVWRADFPRAIGRGDPDEIPAVLIGKLALHQAL